MDLSAQLDKCQLLVENQKHKFVENTNEMYLSIISDDLMLLL